MGLLYGTLRDYHRDPFSHSLLRTKGVKGVILPPSGMCQVMRRQGLADDCAAPRAHLLRLQMAGFRNRVDDRNPALPIIRNV